MKSILRKFVLSFFGWLLSDRKTGISVHLFIVSNRFVATVQHKEEISVFSVFPDNKSHRLIVTLDSEADVEAYTSGSFSARCKHFAVWAGDDSFVKTDGKFIINGKEFHLNDPKAATIETMEDFLRKKKDIKPQEVPEENHSCPE